MNGATAVMYEGAPTTPGPDRFWEIIERHKVTILYTAPDRDPRLHAARATSTPKKHDLSSLRLLGTVGEPINPEAWMWYREVIGGGRCPVVDTWWQTETGGDHDHAAAGRHADQARARRRCRCRASHAEVVDKRGQAGAARAGGRLSS